MWCGLQTSRLVLLPKHFLVSHYSISGNADVETDHKCAVVIDTTTPDMFLAGLTCPSCFGEKNQYDVVLSSTGKIVTSDVTTADFGFGQAKGELVSDIVSVAGNEVSHGAWYRLKEGALMGN